MSDSEAPTFTYEPRPPAVGSLIVAVCLMLGGGLLVGYGIGCTVIDGNGDGPASYVAGDGIGMKCILGVVLGAVGVVLWSFLVDRHRRDLSVWHGAGMLLLTGAIGHLLAISDLGVRGGYAVAAALLAGAGVVAIAIGSGLAARRRREWARDLRLMGAGVAVSATVVDSGVEPGDFGDGSNAITTTTFQFVGDDGTARRVRRRVTIPQDGLVVDGQRTTLWYDPTDPSDDRAVVVALVHALRWNVPVPDAGVDRPPVLS